jgi:hypothetical protein
VLTVTSVFFLFDTGDTPEKLEEQWYESQIGDGNSQKINKNISDSTDNKDYKAADHKVVDQKELSERDIIVSQAIEAEEWFKSKGHYNSGENPYGDYSLDILLDLAANDDPLAQLEAGIKLRQSGDETSAITYLERASVHGFTKSLLELSWISENRYHRSISQESAEDRRSLVEAYAYLEVAAKRGDINARLELEYKIDAITEDELIEVRRLADTIYMKIDNVRATEELEPLSNDIPPV